jgi:hypothetical protein
MSVRMRGLERRSQVLGIAASEFANHGLHGASIEMQGFAACGDGESVILCEGDAATCGTQSPVRPALTR